MTEQDDTLITVQCPPQRLRWLAAELQRAGIPYDVQRAGDAYHVHTLEAAAPVVESVLGYEAQPQRPPSWLDRLRLGAQTLPYFLIELAVTFGVIAALIAGVKFFGLGELPPSFAILFQHGADIPLLRAVVYGALTVGMAVGLRKMAGPRPGGAPPGTTTHRLLSVLLLGGVVVALVLAWMGRL